MKQERVKAEDKSFRELPLIGQVLVIAGMFVWFGLFAVITAIYYGWISF